ncbi:hypothetical protein JL722_9411 [Aureococcus anophagefferens]|nr:hypothetical protein JL722_9411 [Aureococcus anophagefferens]
MGASASIDQVQIICSNVERAVPRTPAGDSDVKNCDRTKLQEEISRAEGNVKAFYEAAWATCVADDLLLATAELQDEFSPADPPREHAEAMHAALERPVKESGGAYYQGPRKGTLRIKEKAEADYEGDVRRVVDVERATGVYDTANDFNAAISKLRAAARGGELVIIRCKDNLRESESGYRDVKLNVALDGFVGELQLTFQSIKEIKDSGAHQVYEVSRVLAASGDDDALARALDGPDLESEQMLTLERADGRSVLDTCGSVVILEAALAKALPTGCCVANVYLWRGRARVRLGIDDVASESATLTSPDETSTTTQQLARISELERIAAAAQPGPVLTAALEVVGGAFKSEAVPEVCVEALLGVVAHLDVGHHGPSARSRGPRNPPVSFRARAAIASSLPLPPRFRAIARPPRDRSRARALLGAVARLDGRDRAGAVVAREASAALEGILARGGSAAREAVFSWARAAAAWPALLGGGGPAVAVARCLGALAAAAAREGDAALVDAFFDLAADERLLRAVKRASWRPTARPARRPRGSSVASRGSTRPSASSSSSAAAASSTTPGTACATPRPRTGPSSPLWARSALAAAAPGDFCGGLRDHALDLLLDAVGPEALDGARYAPHPAGRSDGGVAALELVAGAAPSRTRGALARIAAVVAARLRLGAAGPARLAEWRVLAAVGAA